MNKLTTLTEIYKLNEQSTDKEQKYALREIIVSPNHIFALRKDDKITRLPDKKQLPEDLDDRQEYTKIYFNTLNHSSVVIVGNLHLVKQKLLEG